jgi:hypothetical protein
LVTHSTQIPGPVQPRPAESIRQVVTPEARVHHELPALGHPVVEVLVGQGDVADHLAAAGHRDQ